MSDKQGDLGVAFLRSEVQRIGDALRNAVIRESGCINFTYSSADVVHMSAPPLMPADVCGLSLLPLLQSLYPDNDFDPDNDLDAAWREITSLFHSTPTRRLRRLVVDALSLRYRGYPFDLCASPQEALACFLLLASWRTGRLKVEPDRITLRTERDTYAIEGRAIEHNKSRRRLALAAPQKLSSALTRGYGAPMRLSAAGGATYRFLLTSLPGQRVGIDHLFRALARMDAWAEKAVVAAFFAENAGRGEPASGPWTEALALVDSAQRCPVKALRTLLSTVIKVEDVTSALGSPQLNPDADYTDYMRAKHRAAVLELEAQFRKGRSDDSGVQGLMNLQQLIAGR